MFRPFFEDFSLHISRFQCIFAAYFDDFLAHICGIFSAYFWRPYNPTYRLPIDYHFWVWTRTRPVSVPVRIYPIRVDPLRSMALAGRPGMVTRLRDWLGPIFGPFSSESASVNQHPCRSCHAIMQCSCHHSAALCCRWLGR